MVRRFQFRLETVRKIRERERDAQRLIVAESASATESVRQRVVGLTNEFADNAERSRGVRPVGRLDLHLVRMHLIHRVVARCDRSCASRVRRERVQTPCGTEQIGRGIEATEGH